MGVFGRRAAHVAYAGVVLFVFVLALCGGPNPAKAQQINCVGLPATTDATNNIALVFDPATSSCTVSVLGSGQTTAATSSNANVITFSTDADELIGMVGNGTSASTTALETCDIPGTSASVTDCRAFTGGGGFPFDGTVTLGNRNPDTGALNQVRFTVSANGTDSATLTAAFASLTEIDAVEPDAKPSSAAPVLVATVAKTQTKFSTQNIQRHVDLLTGGGVAGSIDPGAPTGGGDGVPEGPQTGGAIEPSSELTSNFNVSGPVNAASLVNLVGGLSEDNWEAETKRDGFEADSSRDAARFLLPKLSFDTARGDTITGFLGAGKRLNQTDSQTDRPEPGPPERLERADTNTNMWLYGGYSNVKNDRNLPGDDQRFDGDILNVTGGIDHWLKPKLLAGVSFSYSSVKLDTDFNDGRYDEDGYTVAPYILYTPLDWLSVNASVGYTLSRIEQSQNRSTTIAESTPDASTYYANIAAKGTYRSGDLVVAGSLGYVRSHRRVDSFTDTLGNFTDSMTSNTSMVRSGAEAGYFIRLDEDNVIKPYVTAEGTFEFQDLTNDDPVAAEVGGGATWKAQNLDLTAMLEMTTVIGRDDFEQWNIRGLLVKGFESEALLGAVTPRFSFGLSGENAQSGIGVGYLNDTGRLSVNLDLDALHALDRSDSLTTADPTEARVRATASYRF
ncbi:autotransporter outer membrane beta-barrel domain-containing protein [Hwanghaeella grinnelliae]|uniref:Autotransporter outer membrane beta-barrel domain-containing protein n=1 Tax=Hwanghaeella grinnelliae TaxID=2500179 RepID=A0A3S2W7I6_9PROT|nr:autotransporter outer membrane beta-barrel domain-containing protein [Hwanghaeella grinnelliae]RVU34666.1 autotransporter outer membrane beta-barrel domain-containing protein [Hwanghaeella grinnelliae]